MQFIWTFWEEGAKADELRWSIRSVRKYFSGDVKITVVGDRPAWYKGHFIEKRRIEVVTLQNWKDVISKMEMISTHPEVEEEFIWMMDDVYFLNPCDLETLLIPRCSFLEVSSFVLKHKKWKKLKLNTLEELRNRGYTSHDYATHLPQPIIKKNLKRLFHEFDVYRPLLWEVLYGNFFRSNPIDCLPFLHQQSAPVTINDANRAAERSTILNHGNRKGWTDEFRYWLSFRLPDPAPEETA